MKNLYIKSSLLRRNILRLYAVTLLASAIAMGLYIRLSWQGVREHVTNDLERDAIQAGQILHEGVNDAGKLLSIAKFRIEESLKNGSNSLRQTHELLKESTQIITSYHENQNLGLLFFADSEGRMTALEGMNLNRSIQVSDRLYFRLLKQYPSKKYSIGKLVLTRTTGKLAFHMAMPIHDPIGGFEGIVALQLDEEEIVAKLGKFIRNPGEQLTGLSSDGEIVLLFPSHESPTQIDVTTFSELMKHIISLGKSSGAAWIPRGIAGQKKSIYVGYSLDTEDGICSMAIVQEDMVKEQYYHTQLHKELLVAVMILLVISALFIGLYREGRNLNRAVSDAVNDQLTEIPNRRAVEDACRMIWGDALRRGEPISVLFMDIDHFKHINDTWGHDVGDEVLKAVAKCIQESVHRPLDFCCRWGGEEFVLILPNTESDVAFRIANGILDRIREMRLIKKGKRLPTVTLSIGIATSITTAEGDRDRMFSRADNAMLRAKSAGRNRVVVG